MSRVSHAARLERLKRQLRGEQVVTVELPDWLKELAGVKSMAELQQREQQRLERLAAKRQPEVPEPRAKEPER